VDNILDLSEDFLLDFLYLLDLFLGDFVV